MNRFDQIAPLQFIDTYAPLPINELYQIGRQQLDRIDESNRQIADNFKQWAQFRSQSQVDTDAFYNETIGKVSPLIDELVLNPDLRKSAEGRAKIQNMLNYGIDYGALSMLQQSADNLNKRAQIVAEMQAQGVYNPYWDDINMSAWDTLGSGQIMTDMAPLQYKSIQQISDPYSVRALFRKSRTLLT